MLERETGGVLALGISISEFLASGVSWRASGLGNMRKSGQRISGVGTQNSWSPAHVYSVAHHHRHCTVCLLSSNCFEL